MDRIASWGQVHDESEPAYAAFKVYRNTGVKRSLRRTAREVGKARSLIERWSRRHQWLTRIAAWDLEQHDLHKEARFQAISDAEERHGVLAKALLAQVAAELGVRAKGRCQACGRTPVKLNGVQVATALKAGVEVERLSLGLSTAGASSVMQTNVTNVEAGSQTTLVLLREPRAQQLASELLGLMQSLNPSSSLRRLGAGGGKVPEIDRSSPAGKSDRRDQVPAPAATTARLEEAGITPTGRAAIRAARLEAARRRLGLAQDVPGHDRTAEEELGQVGADGDQLEEVADAKGEEQNAAERRSEAAGAGDPARTAAARAALAAKVAARREADGDADLF